MESKTKLQDLFTKYLNGNYTAEELDMLLQHFQVTEDAKALDQYIDEYFAKESSRRTTDFRLDRIIAKADRHILGSTQVPVTLKIVNNKKSNTWIYAVAAAVAAIVFGVWFYNTSRHLDRRELLTYINDVEPGKNTATLTLVDGKVINLDTTKTNVVVTDSVKTMMMLTASTPRGGTYQVTLSDGSRVWLNAASSIKFPSRFSGLKRKIFLKGEAYLEIAKDKRHPFIVESEGQLVEVLGTHFNINAYPEESFIKTTLLEGSVKVFAYLPNGHAGMTARELKPNQQSVLSGNKITVNEVVAEDAIAWKNGYFMFNSEPLEGVMNRVSKWYNITVEYEDDEVRKKTMLGSVSRDENLSKVVRVLQRTGVATFKMEGNKIKISKN